MEIPVEDDDRNQEKGAEEEAAEETPLEDAEGEQAEDEADAATVDMELHKTLDHLRRLQAEFDNYRKRTEKERAETGAWAQSMLVNELLPVLDDLERALNHAEKDGQSVAEGFGMVAEKLTQVLNRAGMERIPALGEEFDPNVHEALLTEPVEPERVGTVLEELVPGYTFKNRVLRPARVKVGMERPE